MNHDFSEILKHLPHRYPFLFVDKIVSVELGNTIHAQKNVSINEDFFNGHFPNKPVMPGVLIIEAMAQAAGGRRVAHSGQGGGANDSHACTSCPIHFVDQPNSTAMLRYYLQLSHTAGSTQTLYINRSSNDGNGTDRGRYISILTAQEIQT